MPTTALPVLVSVARSTCVFCAAGPGTQLAWLSQLLRTRQRLRIADLTCSLAATHRYGESKSEPRQRRNKTRIAVWLGRPWLVWQGKISGLGLINRQRDTAFSSAHLLALAVAAHAAAVNHIEQCLPHGQHRACAHLQLSPQSQRLGCQARSS